MGDDMGNASTMFRLNVSYSANPHSLPATMIVKCPKQDWKNRIPFTAARMNEMEVRFYVSELCDELLEHGVHLPRGFGGQVNARTGLSFIVMEDVKAAGGSFLSELDEVRTMDRAKAIVHGIARFHAPLFDSARFATDYSWVIHQQSSIMCMTKEFFEIGWPRFVERLDHVLPDEVKQRGPLLASVAQQLHDFMGLPPNTLVHGDCHLANAYLVKGTRDGADVELGLYDVQLLRRGKGALDLASFMGGSFSAALLGGGVTGDDGEVELLQAYLDALAELAPSSHDGRVLYTDARNQRVEYTLDALRRDYKMALCLLLVWNVAAALAVPFDTEAKDVYDVYAERLVKSCHRASAIDFALFYLSADGVQARLGLRGAPVPASAFDGIMRCEGSLPTATAAKMHRAQISPAHASTFLGRIKQALKFRVVLRATSSRKGHHGQSTVDFTPEELEGQHDVQFAAGTAAQNFAMDSYYVSAFQADGLCMSLRWCRRFLENDGEVWLALRIPERAGVLAWADHPVTRCRAYYVDARTIAVERPKSDDQMFLTCVEPMKLWRARFTGKLRDSASGRLVAASFVIDVEQCMPAFAFSSETSPQLTAECLSCEPFSRDFFEELKATHQEHYECFSFIRGHIDIAGSPRIKVDAKGMRDRAFGLREWGYMQRYISSYLWVGDMRTGACVNYSLASLPTMTRFKGGFVCPRPGAKAVAMDRVSADMAAMAADGVPPQDWELAFACDGVQYMARGFVYDDASVGLNMANGMWVNLRFAKFVVSWVDPVSKELRTANGYGASEFGYRIEGVMPHRPTQVVVNPVARAKMS